MTAASGVGTSLDALAAHLVYCGLLLLLSPYFGDWMNDAVAGSLLLGVGLAALGTAVFQGQMLSVTCSPPPQNHQNGEGLISSSSTNVLQLFSWAELSRSQINFSWQLSEMSSPLNVNLSKVVSRKWGHVCILAFVLVF